MQLTLTINLNGWCLTAIKNYVFEFEIKFEFELFVILILRSGCNNFVTYSMDFIDIFYKRL